MLLRQLIDAVTGDDDGETSPMGAHELHPHLVLFQLDTDELASYVTARAPLQGDNMDLDAFALALIVDAIERAPRQHPPPWHDGEQWREYLVLLTDPLPTGDAVAEVLTRALRHYVSLDSDMALRPKACIILLDQGWDESRACRRTVVAKRGRELAYLTPSTSSPVPLRTLPPACHVHLLTLQLLPYLTTARIRTAPGGMHDLSAWLGDDAAPDAIGTPTQMTVVIFKPRGTADSDAQVWQLIVTLLVHAVVADGQRLSNPGAIYLALPPSFGKGFVGAASMRPMFRGHVLDVGTLATRLMAWSSALSRPRQPLAARVCLALLLAGDLTTGRFVCLPDDTRGGLLVVENLPTLVAAFFAQRVASIDAVVPHANPIDVDTATILLARTYASWRWEGSHGLPPVATIDSVQTFNDWLFTASTDARQMSSSRSAALAVGYADLHVCASVARNAYAQKLEFLYRTFQAVTALVDVTRPSATQRIREAFTTQYVKTAPTLTTEDKRRRVENIRARAPSSSYRADEDNDREGTTAHDFFSASRSPTEATSSISTSSGAPRLPTT